MESSELQERVDRLRYLFLEAIDTFGRDNFLLSLVGAPRELVTSLLKEEVGIEVLRAALLLAYGDAVLAERGEEEIPARA